MSKTGGRLRGSRLKALREARGLTQDALGKLIGTDGRQIIRYEKEDTDPSSEIVYTLAVELETTADYLIGLSDDANPKLVSADLSDSERDLIMALRLKQVGRAIQQFAVLSQNSD